MPGDWATLSANSLLIFFGHREAGLEQHFAAVLPERGELRSDGVGSSEKRMAGATVRYSPPFECVMVVR